ncbi:MAG: GHKL domain-containing protein [Oscillospiraceae bacterium]|nr:GHKL domain-containing protein [Oscillospiraceae bacterium]
MQPFNFTLFDLLLSTFLAIPYFAIAKILTRDWKLRLKESVYFVLASLFIAFSIQINRNMDTAFFHVFGDLSVMFFLFLYFYKIRSDSGKTAIILTFFAFAVALLAELSAFYPVTYFFPAYPDVKEPLPLMIYSSSVYVYSVAMALLLSKLFGKLFATIMQISRLQTTLTFISVCFLISYHVVLNLQNHLGYAVTLFSWGAFFLLSNIIAGLVCFIFYTRSLKISFILKEKEIEHRALLYYMDECEHQQIAIRKFKHDYQNLFIPVSTFIAEQDWDALTRYYPKVEAASAILAQNDFALEGLSKIKVREVKGILAAKLVLAQNLGVDTAFQIVDEIDHIPVDSVTLVRMLGIILDNAIEALTELEGGKLVVACYQAGRSVTFVVQNTCSLDMPPLSQLRQAGFSTKGEGRGLGLSNLWELASAHPNITLQTDIAAGSFIQKLAITGEA